MTQTLRSLAKLSSLVFVLCISGFAETQVVEDQGGVALNGFLNDGKTPWRDYVTIYGFPSQYFQLDKTNFEDGERPHKVRFALGVDSNNRPVMTIGYFGPSGMSLCQSRDRVGYFRRVLTQAELTQAVNAVKKIQAGGVGPNTTGQTSCVLRASHLPEPVGFTCDGETWETGQDLRAFIAKVSPQMIAMSPLSAFDIVTVRFIKRGTPTPTTKQLYYETKIRSLGTSPVTLANPAAHLGILRFYTASGIYTPESIAQQAKGAPAITLRSKMEMTFNGYVVVPANTPEKSICAVYSSFPYADKLPPEIPHAFAFSAYPGTP